MRYAVIEIKGGFGNQLFQYNFANYLKNTGEKVFINDFWFQNTLDKYDRNQIFEPKFYGFEKASKIQIKMIELSQRFKLNNSLFYREIHESLFDNTSSSLITYYRGHYQDVKFLEESKKFLTNQLRKNIEIQQSLDQKKINSVMVHIRAKDYERQRLEINYYEKAIKNLEAQYENLCFNLFIDNKDVLSDLPFIDIFNSVHLQNTDRDDTLETFIKMIENQHYIISNSTYSFMAALIGSDLKSEVFQPNPWMVHKNINLLVGHWNTVQRNIG